MPEPVRDATRPAKKKPTVALFPLDNQSKDIVYDCFSHFSIDLISADDSTILHREKLEGCVVSLTSSTVENIVAEARNSAWQKRMVIYAVGPAANIRGLTKYGINVLLDSPVTRQAAVKAIHSTRLLLLNELRRYVRLPLAAPVVLEYKSRRMTATSVEISGGGMSLQCTDPCPPADATVSAVFSVPGFSHLNIASVVSWSDDKTGQIGLRFDPAADDRQAVKAWIESYLDLD